MSPALQFTLTLDHYACLSTAIPFITHLHMIVMDAHSKEGDVFVGRRRRDLACAQVKTCAMPRALDFKTFHFSLGQGSAIMGADILNGVIVTTDVECSHFGAIHVNQADAYCMYPNDAFVTLAGTGNPAMRAPCAKGPRGNSR